MRTSKKILAGILMVCLAVICLAGAVLYSGGNLLGEKVRETSRRMLGEPVTFTGSPAISLMPPGVSFSSPAWHSTDGGIAASAKSLRIIIDPWSLASRELRIKEILLDEPSLVLEYGSKPPARPPSGKRSPSTSVFVERVVIQQGSLACIAPSREIMLQGINLTAENSHPREDTGLRTDFELRVLSRAQKQLLLAGNVAMRGLAHYYYPHLSIRQGSISFTAAPDSPLNPHSPLRLAFDAAVNGQTGELRLTRADLDTPWGQIGLSGTGSPVAESFSGTFQASFPQEDPETVAAGLSLKGNVHLAPGALSLSPVSMSIGAATGSGSLSLSLPHHDRAAAISGKLDLDFLQLDKLRLPDFATPSSPTGKAADRPARWPDLDFQLNCAGIAWHGIRLENIALGIIGTGGNLKTSNCKFNVAGGVVDSELGLDARKHIYRVKTKGEKISAGLLLSAFDFGAKHGDAWFAAEFSASGTTWQDIARTFAGQAEAKISNLRINGLAELDREISHFLSGAHHLPDTVDLMQIAIAAKDGEISTRQAILRAKGLIVDGRGTLDLPEQRIGGNILIKAFGMDIPLDFYGRLNAIQWKIRPGFLDNPDNHLF